MRTTMTLVVTLAILLAGRFAAAEASEAAEAEAPLVVQATVTETSFVWPVEDLEGTPYSEIAGYNAYRVDEVVRGELDSPTIVAAAWIIQDRQHTAAADLAVGQQVRLELEPLKDQLASGAAQESNTIEDFDSPNFYVRDFTVLAAGGAAAD